ncbi:hypothetical Protein YC6258_03532 [Gynuella sunshinyii YC6258]|uniref:Uncharacterized protein n=1 Tax=Gynuella sunshinyii YC6258 TaxID=1445510 RepID=A0A0C5VQ57_9GAMM|nr:hypothetical Protein YC6258_03532 [Gynuella sunshinyii YC6258]
MTPVSQQINMNKKQVGRTRNEEFHSFTAMFHAGIALF